MGNTTDYIKEHLDVLSNHLVYKVTAGRNCFFFVFRIYRVFHCRPKSAFFRTSDGHTFDAAFSHRFLRLFLYLFSFSPAVLHMTLTYV